MHVTDLPAPADTALGDHDWSATPLGAPEHWSPALRAAVAEQLAATRPAPRGPAAPTAAAALDALFDTAPLGLGIWDRELRFVRVNASLAQMNGLPPEAHIGYTPRELLPDIAGIDALMERWRQIIATGEPWLDVEVHGGTPANADKQRCWREHFFPIRSGDTVVGIGAVVEETTERDRVEAALRASESRFREFAEASSDVLWLFDLDTQAFEYLSPPLRKLYGVSSGGGRGAPLAFDWRAAIVEADRDLAASALRRVRQGERVTHDFRTRIPGSGKVRWLKNTAFPLREPDGRISRIGGIAQDVTEERDSAARLQMLIGELQHRTRNLMSVIQAVAESTLESSGSLDEFEHAFSARIDALSRVQQLLSRIEGLERVGFDQLLRSELTAFGALPEDDARVSLDGPVDIPLRSGGIQTLALALHELITNSVKYGALSQPAARLSVRWRLLPGGAGARPNLRFEWEERGVAMPVPGATPARVGQGRDLIERAVPYQLDATVDYALTADGVRCAMVLPVSHTLGHGAGA
ncbi:PAS domain-containing protein [Sphingomonas sp. BK235]|uniref:sensor histidine kinase n=1 Tax=Sphingomonas sp. BK235 TaxID=2512131 RepID=UPI0010460B84|nr:PAS domain-containing protein [Sphingomonas sp. BK235]TCP35843.1 PAS domain S-box-containing protein [Sphingomonas sp. BK235]